MAVSGALRAGLVASCICVFLASGSTFGFAALQSFLISHRVFDELCGRQNSTTPLITTSSDCLELQQQRLALLFALAVAFMYVAVLPWGFAIDLLGAGPVMLLGSVLAGAAFAAVASEPLSTMWTWTVAIPLLGAASPAVFMTALILPKYFHRHAGIVTMLVICSFDTGSAVFLLLLFVNDARFVLVPVSAALALFGLAAAVLLPTVENVKETSESQQPLGVSLKLPNYWLCVMFISIWSMRNSFYIASIDSQWRTFDGQHVDFAMFIVSLVLPLAGIVALPVGWLLFKVFHDLGLFLVVFGLGMAYCICNLFSSSVVQYVGLGFYSLLRPLKWGVVSHYIIKEFALFNMGRLFGILNVTVGIFSLLQYLGVYLIPKVGFLPVLAGMDIVALASILFPLKIYLDRCRLAK